MSEICPKCGGHMGKESRMCPLMKRRPVCVSHCCNTCSMYDPSPYAIWTCRYYIEHPEMWSAPANYEEARPYIDRILEGLQDGG